MKNGLVELEKFLDGIFFNRLTWRATGDVQKVEATALVAYDTVTVDITQVVSRAQEKMIKEGQGGATRNASQKSVRLKLGGEILAQGRGHGALWIWWLGVTIFNVNAIPNGTILNFSRLPALVKVIFGTCGLILVGREFKTKALKWGIPHRGCKRKQILSLTVLNTASTQTLWWPGYEKNISDLTFASE